MWCPLFYGRCEQRGTKYTKIHTCTCLHAHRHTHRCCDIQFSSIIFIFIHSEKIWIINNKWRLSTVSYAISRHSLNCYCGQIPLILNWWNSWRRQKSETVTSYSFKTSCSQVLWWCILYSFHMISFPTIKFFLAQKCLYLLYSLSPSLWLFSFFALQVAKVQFKRVK